MLKARGQYYELPLAGSRIHSIVYSGVLRLVFDDCGESYLNLLVNFEVKRYGQAKLLLPKSEGALLVFHDLLNAAITVQEATADKVGSLFLLFSDGTEITVAGSSDYWDFTRHSSRQPSTNVSVSGGLGYLDF